MSDEPTPKKLVLPALRTQFIKELDALDSVPFCCANQFSHVFRDEKEAIKFWAFCGLHAPYILVKTGRACTIQFDIAHIRGIRKVLMKQEAQEVKQFLQVGSRGPKKRPKLGLSCSAPPCDSPRVELTTVLSAIQSELTVVTSEHHKCCEAMHQITAKLGALEQNLVHIAGHAPRVAPQAQ